MSELLLPAAEDPNDPVLARYLKRGRKKGLSPYTWENYEVVNPADTLPRSQDEVFAHEVLSKDLKEAFKTAYPDHFGSLHDRHAINRAMRRAYAALLPRIEYLRAEMLAALNIRDERILKQYANIAFPNTHKIGLAVGVPNLDKLTPDETVAIKRLRVYKRTNPNGTVEETIDLEMQDIPRALRDLGESRGMFNKGAIVGEKYVLIQQINSPDAPQPPLDAALIQDQSPALPPPPDLDEEDQDPDAHIEDPAIADPFVPRPLSDPTAKDDTDDPDQGNQPDLPRLPHD